MVYTGTFMSNRAEIDCIYDWNGTAIHVIFSDIVVIFIFMIMKIATLFLGIMVGVQLRLSSRYHAGSTLFQYQF